ncbi:hypothetical protein E2562_026644 [Oryza meyeriana var. granulata]|uniref:Uncharacterized protein n=1 Tax=Oryza meyeriana var. granulata TaxID=110450 RepID=A0A6G1D833_9ORYZ|nr:hypothetical protein E2562_026644 [Oryza meyeriana var. granulata]
MQQRRKPPPAAAPVAAKQPAPRRTPGPLSFAGALLSLLLVATFLYINDHDVSKLHADFPLAAGARARARSPDLRLLQEAAHRKVNSIVVSRHVPTPTRSSTSTTPPPSSHPKLDQQPLRLIDTPMSSSSSSGRKQAALVMMGNSGGGGGESEQAASVKLKGCDLYKGRWVYDAAGREAPLYRESECEFLTEQVTCMRNGRRDESYQRWRWQPEGCELPRFEARALLDRLRNKRMMFVGDSLNRNQWESMVCLVQSAIPHGQKTLTKFVNNGSLNVFRAHEYNATVEFYWAPFLVQSNSDDPQVHSVRDRVIAWRAIARHAANWKGVHYLVFNTYIWWLNTFHIKVLKSRSAPFGGRGWSSRYALVDRPIAYREVLKTWAKWVDRRIDPNKTTVFFMAMSPNHITPEAWGGSAEAVKCAMETQPIVNRTWGLDIGTDWRLHGVARGVLRSMRRVAVRFVDITALSELRKDAHTSVHTLRQGKLLTPDQQADPRTYADCIHWCLPGLPDTWNHFLYAHIVAHAA